MEGEMKEARALVEFLEGEYEDARAAWFDNEDIKVYKLLHAAYQKIAKVARSDQFKALKKALEQEPTTTVNIDFNGKKHSFNEPKPELVEDGWIKHDGKGRPNLKLGTLVAVKLRDWESDELRDVENWSWRWDKNWSFSDIIAYRIIEEPEDKTPTLPEAELMSRILEVTSRIEKLIKGAKND